jgi:hypothetical protein
MVMAAAAGIGFDLLAWGRPAGPGLAIAFMAMPAAIWLSAERQARSRRHDATRPSGVGPVDNQTRAVFTLALAFAVVPAWRASPTLVTLSILMALCLGLVAVRRRGGPDLAGWTIGGYVRASLELPVAAAEPFLVGGDLTADARGFLSRFARVIPVVRGLVIGFVVLVFFAILFGSADPIFGQILSDTFDIELSFDRIIRFGFVAGFFAWITFGLARRASRPTGDHAPVRLKPVGRIEALIVMALLNALFAGFLVVQFRYLFDGAVGRVDLGYAEYARRGFFELVVVAAAVVGLVLTVDWLVHQRHRFLDALHAVLVTQTFVVMASAVSRMAAYTDAFGLSELRLYTSVFMGWTAVVLIILVATVLLGRRDRFALGGFVSAIVVVTALVAVNPDAVIATVNLDRGEAGAELDLDYLTTLSADAVPTLAERLDAIPARVAERLQARADTDGWRSWSLAHSRALKAIQ